MPNKFKIGDEILICRDTYYGNDHYNVGKVGIVMKVSHTYKYPYRIRLMDGRLMNYSEEEICLNTQDESDKFWLERFANA